MFMLLGSTWRPRVGYGGPGSPAFVEAKGTLHARTNGYNEMATGGREERGEREEVD
jgi:hypothetical protein